MEDKKLLEVGDVLYTSGRWEGLNKHVIISVSPKRAKSDSKEFFREIKIGWNKHKVVEMYGTYGQADLETEELKAEYNLQNLNRKAERYIRDFKRAGNLTADEAKEVIHLFTKLNTATETK